ncbi:hypothetical protein [Rhizobium sp. YJ-22]|uniref:hypothetical protein n=1 Tax=Rhizobium sp. YJ-22 TaxID=3037556 RepID=UPI002412D6D6|nr:hypothetical protein [Rhizobium sp. YJ-22]
MPLDIDVVFSNNHYSHNRAEVDFRSGSIFPKKQLDHIIAKEINGFRRDAA